MSSRIKIACSILALLAGNVCAFGFSPGSPKEYHKSEYDLADYLPHVNGRGEVYINESDENDCYVEMFFYTSMYRVHYHIAFTKHDYRGFSERTSYDEPYAVENAKTETIGIFEGKRNEIPKQPGTDIKYINLALDLLDDSLEIFGAEK